MLQNSRDNWTPRNFVIFTAASPYCRKQILNREINTGDKLEYVRVTIWREDVRISFISCWNLTHY
jgi:hypothetical protein